MWSRQLRKALRRTRSLRGVFILSMGKNVFGYIRRSLEKENLSLQSQENSIRHFVDSQSWTLIKIWSDPFYSGKNLERPAFQDMMAEIDRGNIPDLILVPKLDRISRSLKDVLILLEDTLLPKGIDLKSVTENFDSSTSDGRLLLQMIASFSEFERARINERLQEGRQQLALNGGFAGGHIPYGYMKNPRGPGLVPDPIESQTVIRLFTLAASHYGSCQRLKIVTGCLLHRDSISDLLSNPLYAGLVEYDGSLSKGCHEALVSIRMFNKVQELKLLKARTTSSLFKVHGTTKIPLKLTKN